MKNGSFFEMNVKTNLGYNLNQEILKNNINAICLVPNLISYDVTEAKSNDDYKKSVECDTPNNNNGTSTSSASSWLWTILIIIIILIVIWGIWKLKNNYLPY